MERTVALLESLSTGLRTFDAAVDAAALSFRSFGRVLARLYMHERGGKWPDMFSVLNRYLRTGVEPERLEGERWEY